MSHKASALKKKFTEYRTTEGGVKTPMVYGRKYSVEGTKGKQLVGPKNVYTLNHGKGGIHLSKKARKDTNL